jgi:hypothetical protein
MIIQDALIQALNYIKEIGFYPILIKNFEQAIKQLQNGEPITNKLIVEETRDAKSPI